MGLLRKIILKIVKATAIDTAIKHHYTKHKFLLNTYNHKGYWYHGANREANTIKIFQDWIKPGDYVLEIGAHIGYFSTLYADLVGKDGKVDVFEPSEKNAKYLERNIKFLPNGLNNIVTVVKKGAGDVNEKLTFYIDPISGQNNSFVPEFEGFITSREKSAESDAKLITETVDVITLDSYFEASDKLPDFVKIDVEGFEWNVVQGFKNAIERAKPSLMIEIQSDADKIFEFFLSKGYKIFNDRLENIADYSEYKSKKTPNIFFKFIQ
ncbi:MAG TPA: FkbM family methyltransferase [Flavobacterium sp.]|nr:FkbM family methyltransferase [Flavobacterium sp.]